MTLSRTATGWTSVLVGLLLIALIILSPPSYWDFLLLALLLPCAVGYWKAVFPRFHRWAMEEKAREDQMKASGRLFESHGWGITRFYWLAKGEYAPSPPSPFLYFLVLSPALLFSVGAGAIVVLRMEGHVGTTRVPLPEIRVSERMKQDGIQVIGKEMVQGTGIYCHLKVRYAGGRKSFHPYDLSYRCFEGSRALPGTMTVDFDHPERLYVPVSTTRVDFKFLGEVFPHELLPGAGQP